MEENDIDIIENEGINRLIHDTFVSMDENALWMRSMKIFMMYLLLIRHKNPYTKTQRQVFSLAILLLVNLKVLNGISNTCMT
jgi:hypothetical protein